jgi:hypothetical protein
MGSSGSKTKAATFLVDPANTKATIPNQFKHHINSDTQAKDINERDLSRETLKTSFP